MKIKKSQLALGMAALVAVSTIGFSSATLAAGKTHNIKNVKNSIATSTPSHLERGNHTLTAAQKTAMAAKKAAIDAALTANDYNAWVTAVGPNAPILKKITATNFSSYVQLYNLRVQEQALATQLGLTGANGSGMGGQFGLDK